MFKRVLRLWNTVRHLRCQQIFYRVIRRLHQKKPVIPKGISIRGLEEWRSPAYQEASLFKNGNVRFLNVEGNVFDEGWNSSKRSKLWLYNLHYFDSLNSVGADQLQSLYFNWIEGWLDSNVPSFGTGWEPYVLSLRTVNLVKWIVRNSIQNQKIIDSLAIQADSLFKQIEYHLMGNHLLANAKALIFLGVFFKGKHADKWLRIGIKIYDEQIAEQFLDDGGHFELSPMYQAIMLWDICDLINIAQSSGVELLKNRGHLWTNVLQKGAAWLDAMSHPDGQISFFNDAAFGISPTLKDIYTYMKHLGVSQEKSSEVPSNTRAALKAVWLEESGYCRVEQKDAVLIIDIADIGPSYLPGHAHADNLCFEMSIFNQRVFVNSGISEYGISKERLRQRGTAAHNTISIDGKNSSNVWSGFRVAERAKTFAREVNVSDNIIDVEAKHDGYLFWGHGNVHHRKWGITQSSVVITDEILGDCKQAKVYFYLHPDVKIEKQKGSNAFDIRLSNGEKINIVFVGGIVEDIESRWYPEFGISIKNQCLVGTITGNKMITEISW